MTNKDIVNLIDINLLTKRDALFASIYRQYGAPPNWIRPQGFVSLSKIILEQQVSLASAKAHFNKLNNYLKAFEPLEILKLTDSEMRACQISRQKSKYLRCLSDAILDNSLDLNTLSKLPEIEVRQKLTQIKGIGNWTTDIYLMSCLSAKDIFPFGDIAIINTIKELTNANSNDDILALSKNWKPLRSLASYFLWHYYLKKKDRNQD